MYTLDELFPEKGKSVLVTTKGRELIEKLGREASREVIFAVLCGENIRTQTEPLTRKRVTLVNGAMVSLFARGWETIENFSGDLSKMAISQIKVSKKSDRTLMWPAQWIIGITGKGTQNIFRNNPRAQGRYILDFEKVLIEAAEQCKTDYGDIEMTLGFIKDGKQELKQLNWFDITRLTTAIGAATLTIRGSEKSTYGKLFEHLILGSVLTILGFEYVDDASCPKMDKVFWLADSSDTRECDATVRLRAGKLARFDIGFIGEGNPEIMKDKLTRYASEVEQNGIRNTSQTFIIVDKMPKTLKTQEAAQKSGAEIVQMSMQFWPKELARCIERRLGFKPKILEVSEDYLKDFLEKELAKINFMNFLKGVTFDED